MKKIIKEERNTQINKNPTQKNPTNNKNNHLLMRAILRPRYSKKIHRERERGRESER